MTELDERLKLLDRIEAPDLWNDVRTRDPRRTGEPPSWNRAVAVAVAALVAAVGIAVVARAFLGGTPKPSSLPFHPAAKANGVIAFVRGTRGPNSGIYVIQPDGTGARRLAAGAGEYGEATWSPDGSRIAFTRSEGPGSSSVQALFAAAADGSHARRLFQCGARGCREPAWSPDGRRIAFVSGQDIYTVNADGTDIRRLTRARTPLGDGHPAWSPDGRTIAFSGQTDVFVMAATGGPSRKLTDCGAIPDCIDALDPTWSPDGRLIVFEVERDGGRRSLYLMNADGTGLRQLSFHNDDCCASWQSLPSPPSTEQSAFAANGEFWARVGGGDGPSFVYSVEPDGSRKALLFSDGRDPTSPPETVNLEAVGQDYAWSPDGSKVAFSGSSNPDQHAAYSAIFVMNADGSGLTQLTPDSEVDSGPAWSPDGTRIAYASGRTGPFSDGV